MIAANELRIGNWVLLDTGITPCQKHIVQAKDIYDLDRGLLAEQSIIIEPIPITPEILDMAGFENYGYDQLFYRKSGLVLAGTYSRIDSSDHKFYCGAWAKSDETNFQLDIDYLHELQNLFFALTKTELIISLTSTNR